jgi:probable rRNA maturation factor
MINHHPIRRSTMGVDARYNRRRKNQIICFGSRANVPGNPPGSIEIYNEQKDIPNIDQDALRDTIRRISQLIGYETYDVTVLLVEDEEMRETNLESRNIDAPTDILSFPFLEAQEPGTLVKPQFDIPEYYNLGDMVVDVPYVIRRCQEDQEDNGDDDEEEYEIIEVDNPDDYEDDEEIVEERGVSGAMATVNDPEKRIHMLMVHGMLHLVGYDHEEDEDYELMVAREEEILKELGLLPPAMAEKLVRKP